MLYAKSHQSCPIPRDPRDWSPQAPLSMGFSRQEHWSGEPWPPPGHLPNSGIKPMSPVSPALAGGFLSTSTTWEAHLENNPMQVSYFLTRRLSTSLTMRAHPHDSSLLRTSPKSHLWLTPSIWEGYSFQIWIFGRSNIQSITGALRFCTRGSGPLRPLDPTTPVVTKASKPLRVTGHSKSPQPTARHVSAAGAVRVTGAGFAALSDSRLALWKSSIEGYNCTHARPPEPPCVF